MRQALPLTAIRAFEAAALRLNFKGAAEDLGVTPTAVSHQIRHLEQLCGVRLFKRGSRGVTLTNRGRKFAEALRPAIDQIETAYRALVLSAGRNSVILGAGPIIASRWLAPQLPAFAAEHPDIDLQLLNSPTEIWRRAPEFDIAIAWGHGNWSGLDAEKLFEVSLAPVLTPELADRIGPLRTPRDLLRAPLLHHRNDLEWGDWFREAGVTAPVPIGTRFEDTNVLVQAALSGSGAMLGVLEFLADDISAGRLVNPFGIRLKPTSAYYVVTARSRESTPISALKTWLRAHAPKPDPR